MKEFRFNIFGAHIAITGAPGAWRAFILGAEGKRRLADFVVPDEGLAPAQIASMACRDGRGSGLKMVMPFIR